MRAAVRRRPTSFTARPSRTAQRPALQPLLADHWPGSDRCVHRCRSSPYPNCSLVAKAIAVGAVAHIDDCRPPAVSSRAWTCALPVAVSRARRGGRCAHRRQPPGGHPKSAVHPPDPIPKCAGSCGSISRPPMYDAAPTSAINQWMLQMERIWASGLPGLFQGT